MTRRKCGGLSSTWPSCRRTRSRSSTRRRRPCSRNGDWRYSRKIFARLSARVKTVTSAVCFPPEQLESADLLKQRISEVTLGDIDGPGAGPSRAVVPSPGPWGLWATLGLGLLIAGAFVMTQIVVGIVFVAVASATGQEKLLGDSQQLEANGLFI